MFSFSLFFFHSSDSCSFFFYVITENKIDKLNLVHLVKDMLHLDPATRYQIAKNAFQIRLFDARV